MKRLITKAQIFCIILALLSNLTIAQYSSFEYVCPVPGSKYLNTEQNIILKSSIPFNPAVMESAVVHLNGSKSGTQQVEFIMTEDQKTLLIKPTRKFSLDEKVNVRVSGLRTLDGQTVPELELEFYTKEKELGEIPIFDERDVIISESSKRKQAWDYQDKPWSHENNLPPDFPGPITSTGAYISNNYTFTNLNAKVVGAPYNNFLAILDNFGTPIYYQRTSKSHPNFSVLPNGLLTWAKNYTTNTPLEKYYLADSSYNIIDSVHTGNGYNVDSHDMLLMENGHFLMMSYDPQIVNMSLIVPGGNPDATVIGLVIQEVDLNENVYFQWRSWDHFEITDATDDINLFSNRIDYCHGNAFEFDYDGNILVSCRNMDEITKINYNTGEVIWRFGKNAENNQFDIVNDPIGFSHQHDIRRMQNGHYTLYDNGNLHQSLISRAMEYEINEDNMQATLIWDYQHEPIIYAPVTGSFRIIDNEKRIIGWGGSLSMVLMTELNPDNSVSMELLSPDSITCYRALKFPWETNAFTTLRNISFGNFAGHDDPKEFYLSVRNNSGSVINITGTHNHLSTFEVATQLPLGIFPYTSAIITITFNPEEEGEYNDLLTLNYDNADNSRRIARQLTLNGYWEDDHPFVFFNPANGAVNVDPATEIQTLFSEPIRHKGGDEILDNDIPGIFILKENDMEGMDVPFSGTISEDKMTVTLFPSNVLKEEQQYFVELLAGMVEDFDGNVIEYAEGSFFETGMGVGVSEHAVIGINVFPNPCANAIRLRYMIHDPSTPLGTGSRYLICDLYSISGKRIRGLFEDETSPGLHEMEIDISDLPAGVYFLRIQAGEEVLMKKVVKME